MARTAAVATGSFWPQTVEMRTTAGLNRNSAAATMPAGRPTVLRTRSRRNQAAARSARMYGSLRTNGDYSGLAPAPSHDPATPVTHSR